MKKIYKKIFCNIIDMASAPIIYLATCIEKIMKSKGLRYFKCSRKILLRKGIWPISTHYYEPKFLYSKDEEEMIWNKRQLMLDMNDEVQLQYLNKFCYQNELKKLPFDKTDALGYYYNNESYGIGDADLMYSMIRAVRPKRIIEIGSGFSTLIALEALEMNQKEDEEYSFEMKCIEPYEFKWLENTKASIIRDRLENLSLDIFNTLEKDDFLIIDSTHMIKPGGDVLREYLEILPIIKPGVYIHVHDIFTPREYLREWLVEDKRFWNEQYLLEAILLNSSRYEIIVGMNYLYHNYFDKVCEKFPAFEVREKAEPGAFWIRKR